MEIKKVAVMGAGLMGNQIAMQVAIHGFDVVCYDLKPEMVEKAAAYSAKWFEGRVAKGKMDAAEAEKIQSRLVFTSDLEQTGKDADIVLEAVPDVAEIKKSALASIDKFTPDHCIYGSNSSYLVSSKFCDAVKDPSKVCNMHFFNPALVMKTVEVVKGPHTSQDTFDTVYSFAEQIGKEPVKILKECYGFVVNRIFHALTREAMNIVDQGVASVEDVDKAVRGGLKHAMGPLETLDMTGIDLEYSVYMEKYRTTGDVNDMPNACLVEHYAKGEYGRKSGKGFYEY